ncbi:MAG: TonB-dependent receptor plug domain-containing protein [Gammaproteobacteria bacterium]|nr:TonB-dependent receptor plug domain-containing protein [Gammaproteobacteria bacterium]
MLQDVPLVLSATRLPHNPLKAPLSITVIDRDMIEASSAVEIPDLLRLVPGMQVANVTGNRQSVAYHGAANAFSNRMQILVDGRSSYAPFLNIIDWTLLGIQIADIERIEVIRGPNAAAYGSNAFDGTINIVTRRAFQDPGHYAEVLTGSVETTRTTYRYSHLFDNIEFKTTLSYLEDAGFDNVDDHKKVSNGAVKAVYLLDDNNTVDTSVSWSGSQAGACGAKCEATNPRRESNNDSHSVHLRWEKALSANEDLSVQFYTNYQNWDDYYLIGPMSGYSPAEWAGILGLINANYGTSYDPTTEAVEFGMFLGTSQRYHLEAQHRLRFANQARLAWGGSLRLDQLKSRILLSRSDYVTDHSQQLFADFEQPLTEYALLNAGAMYENSGLIAGRLSPRLSLSLFPSSHSTIRLGASRGYRNPSLLEEYENANGRFLSNGVVADATTQSSGDLAPERITAYELAFLFNSADGRLAFDSRIFREEIDNIITDAGDFNSLNEEPYYLLYTAVPALNTLAGTRRWLNNGHTNVDGAEFQLKLRPDRKTLLSWQYAYLQGGGSIVKKINQPVGPATIYYSDAVIGESFPSHNISLLASRKLPGQFQLSASYFSMSKLLWRGDGDRVPAYERYDLRVAHPFRVLGQQAKIEAIGQNVLDKPYQDFVKQNLFDRRYYLQLSLAGG